jgi:hypothetical protein
VTVSRCAPALAVTVSRCTLLVDAENTTEPQRPQRSTEQESVWTTNLFPEITAPR